MGKTRRDRSSGRDFFEGSAQNHFLEYCVGDAARDEELHDALAAGLGQARAKGQYLVAAFGGSLWRRLAPERIPAGLRPFDAFGDPAGHYAPATQHDIWPWLQAPAQDANFDLAVALHCALAPVAELEIAGFKYRGERDLFDFVDSTGNPKDRAAKETAALIPDGGGAFLMTQQWAHDLPKFNGLGVEAQE